MSPRRTPFMRSPLSAKSTRWHFGTYSRVSGLCPLQGLPDTWTIEWRHCYERVTEKVRFGLRFIPDPTGLRLDILWRHGSQVCNIGVWWFLEWSKLDIQSTLVHSLQCCYNIELLRPIQLLRLSFFPHSHFQWELWCEFGRRRITLRLGPSPNWHRLWLLQLRNMLCS